jgi:hypothetical protein
LSHARLLSITQRRGSTTKPFVASDRLSSAHISTSDAYGTIAEIAWAAVARGIPVPLTPDNALCSELTRMTRATTNLPTTEGRDDANI